MYKPEENNNDKQVTMDDVFDEEEDNVDHTDVVDDGYVIVTIAYQFAMNDFKIKPTTELWKLMQSFCSMKSLDPDTVRFVYDGRRIRNNDTVESVGIVDDSIIDAITEQTGGY